VTTASLDTEGAVLAVTDGEPEYLRRRPRRLRSDDDGLGDD
jgi:hypothetical protein